MSIREFLGSFGRSRSKGMTKIIATNSQYDYTFMERLDTRKARAIWNNTEKDYKLSASVVICGISGMRDYIGKPMIKFGGSKKLAKKIQNEVDEYSSTFVRKAIVEGNFYVWTNYNSKTKELEHIIFNYEDMSKPFFDVDTKELTAVIFRQSINFMKSNGEIGTTLREIRFDSASIVTTYENDIPTGRQRKEIFYHNYGRMPLRQWTYNKGKDEAEGHGLIEPCEPHLRVLHDVMLNRAIEDKRSSRKKYLITAKDPETWIHNTKQINGMDEGDGTINLEDLDVFFNVITDNGKEEKTAYLIPEQSASDSIQIAKLAFMNIIEILGTPEWLYPPKLGASFASAQVQIPRFTQLITNSQDEFTQQWIDQLEIDAMVLSAAVMSDSISIDEVSWKRISLEDAELRANIVNYMMASMKIAKDTGLMDDEEIRIYLDSYMSQLKNYPEFVAGRDEMLKNLEKLNKANAPKPANAPQPGVNINDNKNRKKATK
jgi:hypothetical protein